MNSHFNVVVCENVISFMDGFKVKFLPYFGIFLFAKPEIVAKANMPKRAIPRNKPAP